jgi:hypothetical protein
MDQDADPVAVASHFKSHDSHAAIWIVRFVVDDKEREPFYRFDKEQVGGIGPQARFIAVVGKICDFTVSINIWGCHFTDVRGVDSAQDIFIEVARPWTGLLGDTDPYTLSLQRQ